MNTTPESETDAPPNQPTLSSPRLRLRPLTLSDAKTIQRLAGDRDIAYGTMLIPHPYEDGMAEEWIGKQDELFRNNQSATFAIERKQDDALIGTIGLTLFEKHGQAELGYWVGKPYWGNGYCTEASRAILKYGFRERKLHRIHAKHYVRNPASGRVMQKLGMQQEGVLRDHLFKWGVYEDVAIYGILESEFEE